MTNETANILLPSFEKEDVAEFNGSWGQTSEIFFSFFFQLEKKMLHTVILAFNLLRTNREAP